MRNFIQNLKSLKSLTEIFKALLNYAAPVKVACSQSESSHSSRVLSRITRTLPAICLVITLMLGTGEMWGQTYNSTDKKWYSLYDENTYSLSTTGTEGLSIHTYQNSFVPNDGTFSFDSKLPGEATSSKQSSNSDPHEWDVEDYQITFGGQTVDLTQNVSATSSRSGRGTFLSPYRWTFSYTYNYSNVSGSDLNPESTSFEANYVYKLANAWFRTVSIKNVKIPLAQHIWVQTADGTNKKGEMTKDFGNVRWGEAKGITVNFRSFLTAGNLNVTIVGDTMGDFSFSPTEQEVHTLTTSKNGKSFPVAGNMCASANGAAGAACATGVLGKASEYDFIVYFFPKKENVGKSYTGKGVYVQISDGTNSAKVYLTGKSIKRGQVINWNTNAITVNTTDNITFDAVAKDSSNINEASGVDVTYSPTSGSPAYVDGNKLKIITSTPVNTPVVVTASAAANKYYNAAPSKTKNITINKVTPDVYKWPEIHDHLVYTPGAKVQEHWTVPEPEYAKNDKNNPVRGTFTCDEVLQPAKNSTGYTVTFTPDLGPAGEDWYNPTSATIKKVVAKADQEIIWSLVANQQYPSKTVMDAEATSGLEVTYSITNVDGSSDVYARIVTDGVNKVLQVEKLNKDIRITATQIGDANWNRVDSVRIIRTCGNFPDMPTSERPITASPITYGQKLGESELSGKIYFGESEVHGDLSWVEEDAAKTPTAGVHKNEYNVRFTPTGADANSFSEIIFKVDITVNKATPTLTWNIEKSLSENSTYTNFFSTTNTDKNAEASLKVTVSNSTLLQVSGRDLRTGDIGNTSVGGLSITVEQIATDNFNALTATTLSPITITPRGDVCLPVTSMDGQLMKDLVFRCKEKYAWYNEDIAEVPTTYTFKVGWTTFGPYNVKYSQYKGIGLGNWDEGFTGLTWEKIRNVIVDGVGTFSWENKYIDISFTGVPDSISFTTQLQTVQFKLAEWHSVGATTPNWNVYESKNGNFGDTPIATGEGTPSFDIPLDSTTRFVRIEYQGNFTGFIQNLKISRKQYIRVKNNIKPATFGTREHPLQQPQDLTIMYASIGNCKAEGRIDVSTTGPFYVDEPEITDLVNIDQIGEKAIRVRCNDVGKDGKVIFKDQNGDTFLSVDVSSKSSENSTITAGKATYGIFQTGSEHASAGNDDYRALHNHNFTKCFDGSGNPRFDYLYIYGVTENLNHNVWDGNPKVPAFVATDGTAEGTASTPCFVYAKNGNQYEYVNSTFDAANTELTISENKKVWISGYRPANKPSTSAIQINSNANVYLDSTEIIASGSALKVNAADVKLSVRKQNNSLTSLKGAAVQLAGESAKLTIEDSWIDEASADLALKSADGKPSIELGAASDTVVINGTQLKLQNADKRAIAQMSGEKELTGGVVRINDGTITGADILGMPLNTLIDGGTFNDGPIQVYDAKNKAKRPRNSRGELLARIEKDDDFYTDKDYEWYGHKYLKDVAGKVYPMLLDESLCIFHGKNGTSKDASKDENWNRKPSSVDDDEAWIRNDIEIKEELVAKSIIMDKPVTVLPTGGITVGEGGIEGSTVDNFTLKAAQDGAAKGQTGFLRISPAYNDTMPHATVEMFCKAYIDPSSVTWQYMGVPITGVSGSDFTADGTYRFIYGWSEGYNDWYDCADESIAPFRGFCFTQNANPEGEVFAFKGQLVAPTNQSIELSCSKTGYHVLANSFMAPIDITKLTQKEFLDAIGTVYLFNTGSYADWREHENSTDYSTNAGQYIAVTPGTAKEILAKTSAFPVVIPPMQGFYVKTSKEFKLTLDYSKIVFNGEYSNSPLRAPSHLNEAEDTSSDGFMKVILADGHSGDYLYMLASDKYDKQFENGYDAQKWMSDDEDLPNVFAVEGEEQLAIDATSDFDGAYIGLRTGKEALNTLYFKNVQGNDAWTLEDTYLQQTIDIKEDASYSFYAPTHSLITDRFRIVKSENEGSSGMTTDVEQTHILKTKQKFIYKNQLMILKDGVLYDARGQKVTIDK